MTGTRTRIIRVAVVLGIAGTLFGPLALLVTDEPSFDLAQFTVLMVVIAGTFGVVTWLGASSQPDNRVVWILALFVFTVGAIGLGQFISASISPELALPLDNETTVPATLDPSVAWTEGITIAISTIGFTALLTLGILLFPDGTLPSRRWRPVAYTEHYETWQRNLSC